MQVERHRHGVGQHHAERRHEPEERHRDRDQAVPAGGDQDTAATGRRTPIRARPRNPPPQSVPRTPRPPMLGATTGATPKTRTSREKYAAAAAPLCRSRTTARATTMLTPPAMPCASRA